MLITTILEIKGSGARGDDLQLKETEHRTLRQPQDYLMVKSGAALTNAIHV